MTRNVRLPTARSENQKIWDAIEDIRQRLNIVPAASQASAPTGDVEFPIETTIAPSSLEASLGSASAAVTATNSDGDGHQAVLFANNNVARVSLYEPALGLLPVVEMALVTSGNMYFLIDPGALSGDRFIVTGSSGVGIEFGIFDKGSTPVGQQTVTGSRGGNAALASLLTALENYGLIVDSSS